MSSAGPVNPSRREIDAVIQKFYDLEAAIPKHRGVDLALRKVAAKKIAIGLKADFSGGDKLAPFECCHVWQRNGLPTRTLPQWVVKALADIAARYFAEAPYTISDDQINKDDSAKDGKTTPRQFNEKTSRGRRKAIPSLDEIAGVRRAWRQRIARARDAYMNDYVSKQVNRARSPGAKPSDKVIPDGYAGSADVLGSSGRLTESAQQAIAKRFRMGRKGSDNDAGDKARTLRRHIRKRGAADK